jgi:hypothetical protein
MGPHTRRTGLRSVLTPAKAFVHPFRVDPLRVETPLFGLKRRAALERCDQLLEAIADLDRELADLSARRRALRHEVRQLHRRIAPNLARRAGRCPGPDGREQLPPVRRNAVALWGRRLRTACLAILERCGPLPLVELHAELHRRGYVLANPNHVKALADALGHEADNGRVRRIRRGVYELAPGTVLRRRQRLLSMAQLPEDDGSGDEPNPRFSAICNAASERFSV